MSETIYDVIIIGGGPAGYTAALYAARAGFKTVVIEKLSAGGQMCETMQIDNYPGFEQGIDGFSLGLKMQQGAERFGAETKRMQVVSVDLTEPIKTVNTDNGSVHGKCVIIATGANHRHLGLADEEKLIGRGVGYCAACDGMFYKDKTVAVVGGGNSAAADALLLSKICKKVILIHRRDTLRATKVYHDPLMKAENVEFMWNSTVEKLLYGEKLTGAVIKNVSSGELNEISCDGMFISIGRIPYTDIFKGKLSLDNTGYIIADETGKTNLNGVFVAGDVRTKAVRQIVTAVADGAAAAFSAEEYLANI